MTLVKAGLVVTVTVASVAAAWTGGDTRPRGSGDPAGFLDRLTGEWSVVSEAVLGPGQDPIRTESRVSARKIGGNWVVAESAGTTPAGQPYTAILTLGWDPAGGRYVGTWIDSMQTHLWLYAGDLDGAGTALTLETEGPILGDATRRASYREIIEVVTEDHRVMRSMILGPDGKWFEFARAEYRRIRVSPRGPG